MYKSPKGGASHSACSSNNRGRNNNTPIVFYSASRGHSQCNLPVPPLSLHWQTSRSLDLTPRAASASVLSERFSPPSITSTRHVQQLPSVQPMYSPNFSQAGMMESPSFTSISTPSLMTFPI